MSSVQEGWITLSKLQSCLASRLKIQQLREIYKELGHILPL